MGLLTSSGTLATPSNVDITGVAKEAQPYATNVLDKSNALINKPAPAYTGQLTSGPSSYQSQAWKGLANLSLPQDLIQAGQGLDAIADKASAMKYSGPTSVNQYAGTGAYTPTSITNTYKAPSAYQSSNIQNTYRSPNAYVAQDVTSGTFDSAAAEQYMNPYLKQALDPQIAEAQRQAQIMQMANNSNVTSKGAFGGTRAALLEAEGQRNLGTNLANITGQGYNQAYQSAMQQYNADQARSMDAQKANVQQAQFAAQQGMTDAQMMAQYGMTAAQANEASRQFASNQSMTAAQLMAQYGMDAQKANETARQFAQSQALANAQNKAQYGQAAQAANVQNAQFGATYGLDALKAATSAEQARANAGATQAQYGLANLNALAAAGNTQQSLDQAALNAKYNQYLDQRNRPWTELANQASLIGTLGGKQTSKYGAEQSDLQKAAGVTATAAELMKSLKDGGMTPENIKKALKSIGIGEDMTYTGSPAGMDSSNINYDLLRNMDDTDSTYRDEDGNLIGSGE